MYISAMIIKEIFNESHDKNIMTSVKIYKIWLVGCIGGLMPL